MRIIGFAAMAVCIGGACIQSAAAESNVKNPILQPWAGPYGGVPPFDAAKIDQIKAGLEQGMEEQRAEIERIVTESAAPTFANTIAALERSGRALDRVSVIYRTFAGTMSTPEFQAVEREMAPKLAAFADEIVQNGKLFERIAAVYDARDEAALTPEQKRLAWHYHTEFVHAGARLGAEAKGRLVEINQRLAALFAEFNQNVLAEEAGHMLVIEKEADLAGLPESLRSAAAAAAEERGHPGRWAILNTRSSMEPFLTYSDRRDLRETVWRTYYSRADNGGPRDNNKIIQEILALRSERAKLLGFRTHAHWRLENTMAKTPEKALGLMETVWEPAVARVREEVADMQAIADKEAGGKAPPIEPWDYRYFAEKVRKAKYDFDQNQVRPYLQLEKLREGMFWVAGELFGLRFAPVENVPVYHPDVRVWEVKDGAERHVGLWYFDPYARTGKRSGAWMSAYRRQERFDGAVSTLVSNNSNFVKAKPGEPALISWEDADTLFHEFGHALHGLCSDVSYPSLSGTDVARDYVEFPSQLLEHWLETDEVLNRFALHHETGEPLPRELVQKIESASTFNQGFSTVEYLIAALVDMKLHLASGGGIAIEPRAFERQTLEDLGMPREIVMRHRLPHFSHLFSSDSYSAGYYSYLWSDTLTADAYEAFSEAGGPYDKAVAKRLRDHVFSRGNTVDPAESYRAFRGRDASIEALMRKRGFPLPKPSAGK